MEYPDECSNIEAIRSCIDEIDREIIVVGKRFEYVKAAANKTTEASVKATERFDAMLQQRRSWAEEARLNQDVIEKLYRDLVSYFIDEELKQWKSKSK